MLRAGALLGLAILVTLLSSQVQRAGPERAIYNHECVQGGRPCLEPRVAGGFPLQYWFDTPGVSVPHQLGLGEDEVRLIPFAADVVFFGLFLVVARFLWKRLQRGRLEAKKGSSSSPPRVG